MTSTTPVSGTAGVTGKALIQYHLDARNMYLYEFLETAVGV